MTLWNFEGMNVTNSPNKRIRKMVMGMKEQPKGSTCNQETRKFTLFGLGLDLDKVRSGFSLLIWHKCKLVFNSQIQPRSVSPFPSGFTKSLCYILKVDTLLIFIATSSQIKVALEANSIFTSSLLRCHPATQIYKATMHNAQAKKK